MQKTQTNLEEYSIYNIPNTYYLASVCTEKICISQKEKHLSVYISKTQPAATHRYIYQLHRLTSSEGQAPGMGSTSFLFLPTQSLRVQSSTKSFWIFHSSKSFGTDSEVVSWWLWATINSNFHHRYYDLHNQIF